jgi:outer membrane protein assembly factor BamA
MVCALGIAIGAARGTPAIAQSAPPDSAALAVPQRDIMDVVARILRRPVGEPEPVLGSSGGFTYSLLPGVGYNPSFGAYVGISVVASGYLGDPTNTGASLFSAGGSISTTSQVLAQVRTDFCTPGNRWKLNGDWRYLDTTEDTYGLGEAQPGQSAYPMGFTLYRFYQTALYGLGGSSFNIGLGFLFDRHEQIDDTRAANGESTPYTDYTGGSLSPTVSSGISLEMLADTRDNPINATRGLYSNTSLRSFTRAFGSDHDWQALWTEFRAYRKLPSEQRQIIGVWTYVWLTFGTAPYFDLPASTWDRYARASRGYLRGRIRGPSQIYTEGEYRRTFTRDGLLGGVAFFNVTATNATAGGPFGSFDPGGGVGLRFKFNKRSDTNAAVDFAWGEGSNGIFFGLQEVF